MMSKKNFFIIYNIGIILLLIYFLICPSYTLEELTSPIENRQVLEKFADETTLEQEFISNDNYDSYGLYFATYGYIHEKGYVIANLENIENKKHCQKKIALTSLTNITPTKINCPLEKNKKYSLKISVNNIHKKHEISIYTTSVDDDNHTLLVNNEEINKNLIMYYYKTNKTHGNMIYIILLVIIDIIIYPFIFFKKERRS